MAIVSSGKENAPARSSLAKQRVVDSLPLPEDFVQPKEDSLRPNSWKDYIGQPDLKKVLGIAVKAALDRGDALDHVLLYGPPGLGKTTMALVLAKELGVKCRITSAPSLERPRDIIGLLVNLQPREVLFVDEIHRLSKVAEELLYPAMEDRRLDLTVGKGTSARTRVLDLPPFTLVGATTRAGALSSPLRDRFGLTMRLDFYKAEDLKTIVNRASKLLGLSITDSGCFQIASRCRGTPRIANRLLRRVRDFATVHGNSQLINESLVNEALRLHQVDSKGLDLADRRFLKLLLENFGGGPAGLETLAAAMGEDALTLESVLEPFLLQLGFLQRTPRGRVITNSGRNHLAQLKKI